MSNVSDIPNGVGGTSRFEVAHVVGEPQTADVQTFKPVWISSHEHLRTLAGLFEGVSWFRRHIWTPAPPRGFPRTSVWVGLKPAPLVCFAIGTLTVSGNVVTFRAGRSRRFRNLDEHLQFEIRLDQNTGLDRHYAETPVFKQCAWSWIVLRSPQLERELLLSVGGMLIGEVKKRTGALCRALQAAQLKGGSHVR